LKRNDVAVRFGGRLQKLILDGDRVAALEISEERIVLEGDLVVLATPPWMTSTLVPDLVVPDQFCAIVNAHFRIATRDLTPMVGVIGGTAEWIFAFPDRISVTISGANAIVDKDRETLVTEIWRDVAKVHRLAETPPPWQIVKERRATFMATPEQVAKRPKAQTRWRNLFLAGDWTDTGLPATIEGAIRSGDAAADLALREARL
jgi:hydroxysqualene dehydroxylase